MADSIHPSTERLHEDSSISTSSTACELTDSMPECDNIATAVQLMYEREICCDAEIRCEETTYRVHQAILCTRSEYFRKAFLGKFEESHSKSIAAEEDSTTIKCLLDFLYLDQYTSSGNSTPMVHAMIYAAADKYDIPGLKVRARYYFGATLDKSKTRADFDISSLVHHVYEVSHSRADDLRVKLIRFLHSNLTTLLEDEQFTPLLEDVSGLAADLLRIVRSPPAQYCDSRHCKTVKELCIIPACRTCRLNCNLRSEPP